MTTIRVAAVELIDKLWRHPEPKDLRIVDARVDRGDVVLSLEGEGLPKGEVLARTQVRIRTRFGSK